MSPVLQVCAREAEEEAKAVAMDDEDNAARVQLGAGITV